MPDLTQLITIGMAFIAAEFTLAVIVGHLLGRNPSGASEPQRPHLRLVGADN